MENNRYDSVFKCYLHLRDESNMYDKDLGHAYLYKNGTKLIIYCAKDSIRHLYTLENRRTILVFDMENDIPNDYYDKIIEKFLRNGFYSNTCYNYSMYNLFIQNAKQVFTFYKTLINNNYL
jgi:hypothetical protein